MKRTYLHKIVYLALLICALSSCTEQLVDMPVDGSENQPPQEAAEKVQLEMFMRTDEFRTPVSDSPANKAMLRSLADEDGIERTPFVLVFKGTGDNAIFVESVQAFELSGIHKMYIQPTKQTTACRLLILANPQDYFYLNGNPYAFTTQKLDSLLSGKTLSYTCANLITKPLSSPQTTVPFAGNQKIPMSYIENVASIDDHTQIGTPQSLLEMRRVAAKIVVKSDLSDFTFTGITAVVNAPKRGQWHLLGSALLNNTGNLTEYNAGDSYATDIVTATVDGTEQHTINDPIYLYEADVTHKTYLIISGMYKGVSYFYKLPVADNNQNPISILRNHQYTIHLTKVSGPGFESVADLKLASGAVANMSYDIELVDVSSHEILANEHYYLSLSNSVFIAYTDARNGATDTEFELFSLTTNCTYDFPDARYITHDYQSSSVIITYPVPVNYNYNPGQKSLIPIASNSNNPVSTVVKARVRCYASDTSKMTLKLGDLEKNVFVRSRWESAIPNTGSRLTLKDPNNVEYYLFSGYIGEEATKDWIKLSSGTNIIRNDSASIVVDDGKISIHVFPNETGVERRGTLYLTAGKNPANDPGGKTSSFRIKVDITQRKD